MFKQIIAALTPNLVPVSWTERARASFGALLGIFLTAAVTRLTLGASGDLPMLVAPMGASAVLLFAAPSSPLAQPWSILGGNLSAALLGITCRVWIPDPYLAAALAVGLAIGIMFLLRCLHPPGGAVAIVCALASPAVADADYWFVLAPVGVNSLLLLLAALAFNNLTGRRYPHPRADTADSTGISNPPPSMRVGFTLEDLDEVLGRHDEVIDIDRDDLAAILHETEFVAYRRRSGTLTCGDIMSREVATVAPTDSFEDAWRLLRKHGVKALPVTAADGTVLGIVTQTDLLDMIDPGTGRVSSPLAAATGRGAAHGLAGQIEVRAVMTSPVRAAHPETTIAELVPLMADAGLHHLPVVDGGGRLVGIVTQSDLVAALFFGAGDEAAPLIAAA